MTLIKIPNEDLTKESLSIDVSTIDKKTRRLVIDMYQFMNKHNGVGLSACQIGINKKIFITNALYGKLMTFINSSIIEYSKETEKRLEGCLSIPFFESLVERPKEIIIEYFDEYGNQHKDRVGGFLARVIQHEHDHTMGKLFTSYLSGEELERYILYVKKYFTVDKI